MEHLEEEVNVRQNKLVEIVSLLSHLYQQRQYANGNVRVAYTDVIHNELYNLMKEVDGFKVMVCEMMSDIDTEAVMNITRFPNMATPKPKQGE
jgi:hypothetical protein